MMKTKKGENKMGCDIHTVVEIKKGTEWIGIDEVPEEFDKRSYNVFAFLANVRNSFNTQGFNPKGFPDDMSEKAKKEFENDIDLHSKSYLTLKELNDADKSDYYSIKCRITKVFWEKFKELGGQLPDGMEVEEDFKVDSIVDALRLSIYPEVIIKWQIPEEEQKETTLYAGIEALKEIATKNNINNFENIRIVFCFDN